ncbi:MAG: LicD family protein [Clostridium sp.]|nr:LicD family protein [Clostridium sp.]
MLYKEYDAETLQSLKNIELELLRDFQKLCERHGLEYFAGGGTAIGAVRHQGFIPWDDDIDVNLYRDDYELFLKYAEEEYSDKYEIMNAETSDVYPLMSTRWMKKGTKFKEECFKDLDLDLGVFLDIYCFDNVPDDDKKMRRQGRSVWFLNKLMILKAVKKPVLYFDGWKAKVVYVISWIVHTLLNLFHVSNAFLYKQVKKELTKYNGQRTKRIAYYFDPTPFTSVIDFDDVFPTRKVPFEDGEMRVGCHVEKYLEKRFGDYMKLPPEDKRHNHPPYIFDLGDEAEV